MKPIILPRGYISWSAMTLWEKSPARFEKEYFAGGERLDTKYLKFGKSFAQYVEELCDLEKELGSREAAAQAVVSKHGLNSIAHDIFLRLPMLETSEQKIIVEIDGVKVLSYLDSSQLNPVLFKEYKTGKHPWDRAKVQKHGQLAFYATILHAFTGEMPEYCDLVWIQTKEAENEYKEGFYSGEDKPIEFTGEMKEFRRNFQFAEVERMRKRIRKNAEEISEAYEKFRNNLEI
jgi:hypothetical protein